MHDLVTAPSETRFSFPAPIPPESIAPDSTYVVAVRSSSLDIHFIGPFTPLSPLKPIGDDDVVFRGNFRLRGLFTNEDKVHNVVIPRTGRAIIYRMEYSLYMHTPALAHEIARIQTRKEDVIQTLMYQYKNEKY
jgi:hypothetical protein